MFCDLKKREYHSCLRNGGGGLGLLIFATVLQNIGFIYQRLILIFSLILLCHTGQGQFVLWVGDAQSRRPINGAQAYVHERILTLKSDSGGRILFPPLKPGLYHIHVFASGYQSQALSRVLTNAGNDTVWMHPSLAELKAVEVEDSRLRLGERENALSVLALTGEQLAASGSQTLAGALADLPGLQAVTTGTAVARPLIRGLGFTRLAIFDHGIRQEGQQWGQEHTLEIDVPGVERIEIIKGPGALLYGSDAMVGVISLQPTQELKEGEVKGKSFLLWRSVNQGYQYGLQGQTFQRSVLLKAGFSAQDFADFRVPAETFIFNSYQLPLYGGLVANTAGRERSARFSAGLFRKWGFSRIYASYYRLHVGFFPGAHGIPNLDELQPDGQRRNISLPAQLVEHFKVIHNSNVQVGRHWAEWDVGLQYNHRRELSWPHSHGMPLLESGTTELEWRLLTVSGQIRFHQAFNSSLQCVYALSGQYRYNRRAGFAFFLPDFRDWNVGLTALAKWRAGENLFVTGGIRGDWAAFYSASFYRQLYDNGLPSHIELASPQLNRRFGNLSGALGFSRIWHPSHNFKLNLGSSFRLPQAVELTANGIHHGAFRHEKGDSGLRPERGLQLDVSYSYNRQRLALSTSMFFNYFLGFIYLTPTAQFSPLPEAGLIWQYEQADGLHTGLEADVDYHPSAGLHLGLGGQALYTLNPRTGYSFPLMPPPSALFKSHYDFKLWGGKAELTPGAELRLTMPQYFYARNELFTPGYAVVNLRFQAAIHGKYSDFILHFRVDNLLNTRYFNHLSVWRYLGLPEPGRNLVLGLSLPISFKTPKPRA